jgi:hypothetical protein
MLLNGCFEFLTRCMKRCIALFRIQSTDPSRGNMLFTIEYLRSLRLKTSRRVQARKTRCAGELNKWLKMVIS